MRVIFLFCLLFYCGHQIAHAQQPPLLLDPVKDKKEVQGYTIQLRPAPGNTVLFEIFKQGRPMYQHPMHPVTMLPEGFPTKEEAYKVAEWMIKEYGRQPHPFPPMVPPHVTKELKVSDPFSPRSPKQ
jgi:hypothetical protein